MPAVSSREISRMHADHRKPVVAFVVLVILAAVVVGFQRADARTGRFLTSFATVTAHTEGPLSRDTRGAAGGEEHLVAVARAWFTAPSDAAPTGADAAAGDQRARQRGASSRADAGRAADLPASGRSGAAKDNGAGRVGAGRDGTPVRPSRSARRIPGQVTRHATELGREAVSSLRRGRAAHAVLEGPARPRRNPQSVRGRR